MATETQLTNRKLLIEALRAEMPPHFTWDFGEFYRRDGCATAGCAIGLAREMGLVKGLGVRVAAKAFGLDYEVARTLFSPDEDRETWVADGYGVPFEQVTPQMVADKLELV